MYLLDPKTMRVRLRKDAEQFSLFGGDPTPVALTPKGQRAKKQREKWGTQTELFPSNQFSVPTLKPKAPKAAKQPLKPKAPKATLKPKAKEGDTRINRAGNQEVLRSGRWRLISKDAPVAPGLAVLRDEPAAPAPAAVEPEPTTIAEAIRQNKAEGKRRAGLNPDNFKPEVGQQFNIAGNDLKRSQGDWQIFAIRDGVVSLGRLKDGKLTNPSVKNLFTVTTEQLNAMVTTGSAVLKDAPEPTPVSTPEPAGANSVGLGAYILDQDKSRHSQRKGGLDYFLLLGEKNKGNIDFDLVESDKRQKIQGVGSLPAIPARDLQPGDVVVGNYASLGVIDSIKVSPSGKTLEVSEQYYDRISGKVETRVRKRVANFLLPVIRATNTKPEPTPVSTPEPAGAPEPTTAGADDSYILHRKSLRPSKQEYSYGRRAQSVTHLPHRTQVAVGSIDELKAFAAQYPDEEWVIEGTAKAEKPGDVWTGKGKDALAPKPTPAPAEPPAPSLETDADFASTKRQEDRIAINQQVRDLLAQKPDGPYTQDEMTLLAKYSGKGGITQDEGSLSEYYTRPDVAKFTTDLLYQNGYKGGVVLEPSCGNGVFLHQLKGDSNTLAVGVELDSTSGKAAEALNPHADVNHGMPFERFMLDNPNFTPDAIVGNVPFGPRITARHDLEAFRKVGQGWTDSADVFVHESFSRLKPGGTMSLIVPHGVITGKGHAKLRQELMKQGRVVGAYRLPNTAFSHTGTQTITDILVIQKHPDPVLNAIAQKDQGVITVTRDDAFIHGKYFEENPENVLGTRRTVKDRWGKDGFTIDGSVEDALAKAPPLAPKVSYDGLNLPTQDDAGPQQGDEKYIGGRLYRFEGHPGRWHLVEPGDGVEAEEGADPSAYGTGSVAEAEAMLKDPGQRVMIDPENLRAMAQLAGSTLTPAEAAAVKDASMAVDQMGSTVDKAKLAHAMLLAGHLQRLQKMGTDDPIHLEQALAMLQAYREAHGNPATDRSLSALAKQLPTLLHLQGAFDEEGTVSDYFANHEAVMEQAKRSHSEAGAAMGEAFRAAGGEAVTLGEIRQHLDGTMTDDDLAAALAADPTVGYMGGGYMPLERLLVGNGFNLMDALLMEADTLPEGSPLRRKLEEQVGMIRARLQPRAMEDITTPFWAVGSWIPVDALNAFLAASDYRLRVEYNALASEWRAVGEGGWGIGQDILTTMNRGRISHGVNTKEAKEAIAALEQQFGQWLSGSDYRLQVEEAYNVAFNGDLPQEFSGEPLDIPLFDQHGGDPENGVRAKRLHDYQNSTIRQMAEQGRGIIALGVGLGKTASAIGLALHLKGLGRAKKPTFVVPKSVLANWVREIDFWAPGANVMILGQTQQFWANGEPAWEVPGHKVKTKGGNPATDANGNYLLTREDGVDVAMAPAEVQKRSNLAFKDDDAATKKRKMRQLSQNSYDIVLMSEPVFQTIKLSTDVEQRYLDDITQAGVGHINPNAKDTHKKLEQIEKRRTKLADRTGETEDTITFEELGIDALFHDEAHHLKNLYGTQRSGDVAFLSQAESDRSLDFYYKARYIREQNNNQNCYLLTATPTTNNPLEAFNMLQHVCPEEFEARGIQNIDDFLGMFGKIESVTVPGVDLEMTEKNGLVGFKNLKDLRHLFNKYTRMQSAKDVGLPIPEELTQDHYVDMTDAQKEVYADLKVRAQKVQEDENDHIFSIISDMDKAAIDLNYYNQAGSGRSQLGQMAEGEKSPKIEECANQVMSSRAGNGGKQIVFCDAVQLHEDLKRQLVEAGYPEDEIAIVNAGTVPKSSDRQKISQAYNSGRISLVIGNTATMGEGMNFQIGTTDIHHLTTPWTPAAIEQRNGRGVRQGNELDGVNCHYYHAKGSFDGYRKGVVERKRGWIDDLWRGDADEATNQNTGALSMDDIELMMADDPEAARAKLEANKEVQMARHSAKMTGQTLKQFSQLQTMKLALSKMAPDQRNSERGRALEGRVRATAEALGRNQYFPHKDLLDGSAPAYVGTDGTVLRVGDHVQKSDGSVFRIQAIDPSSGKMETVNVSGSDSSPNILEKKSRSFKFDSINRKDWKGVKPIPFDTAAHAERVISKLSTYSEVARLDPDTINANRDRLLDQIKEGGYSRVPYLDPKTNLVEEARISQVPESAQVLWPHDGEALEHCLRTMGDPAKEGQERRYHDIAASLMGQGSWYDVAAELKPRIEAYREQHKAMAEQGPKEGDTRINSAGNQEVFRSGRWHRVGEDAPAADSANAELYETVNRFKAQLAGASKENVNTLKQASYFADLAKFDTDDILAVTWQGSRLSLHQPRLAPPNLRGHRQSFRLSPKGTGASSIIQTIAQRHGVDVDSLSAFVESTLSLSRLDSDQLSDLLTPLRLNWKDRAKVEENLMRDLLPVLNTRANGWQKIAGLDVWADSLDAPEPTTVSASEPTGASPSPTAKGLKSRNLIGPLPGEGEDLTPDPGDSDWAASDKRQTQSLRDSAVKNREMVDRLMADPDVAKVLNRHLKAGEISVNSNGDVGMSATRRDSLERAIRKAEPGLMRGFDSTLADMIALKGLHDQEQPAPSAPAASSVDLAQKLIGVTTADLLASAKPKLKLYTDWDTDAQLRSKVNSQLEDALIDSLPESVSNDDFHRIVDDAYAMLLNEAGQGRRRGTSTATTRELNNLADQRNQSEFDKLNLGASADPAQAIVDGMMALYRADDDGATERNDTGFNGFHTPYKYDGGVKQVKNEFVANMIERIEAGQTLTPNQLAACAKILTVYRKQLEKQHGVVLPTTEAIKAHVGGGDSASEFKMSMKTAGAGTVRLRNGEYHVSFPYDRSMVARVKSITRRGNQLGKFREENGEKFWRFPGDDQTLAQIMDQFPEFDLKKSARHYTLAGVAYELRRVADRVFLKKVSHAI